MAIAGHKRRDSGMLSGGKRELYLFQNLLLLFGRSYFRKKVGQLKPSSFFSYALHNIPFLVTIRNCFLSLYWFSYRGSPYNLLGRMGEKL